MEMKTSDWLDRVAEQLRSAMLELRRVEVDLPLGQTLEVAGAAEAHAASAIDLLQEEAAALRSRFRD